MKGTGEGWGPTEWTPPPTPADIVDLLRELKSVFDERYKRLAVLKGLNDLGVIDLEDLTDEGETDG